MKDKVRRLIEQSESLFTNPLRMRLVKRWQRAAEQFYPERADFMAGTSGNKDGGTYSGVLDPDDDQITDFPVLTRRMLSNQFSAMLRPRGVQWFHIQTGDETINNDPETKQWLSPASERLLLLLYDNRSHFIDATNSTDEDIVVFGNGVIEPSVNKYRDGFLWRNWHLRDVAWAEDIQGETNRIFRKQRMTARDVVAFFGKSNGDISETVTKAAENDPYHEIMIQHIVVPAGEYSESDQETNNRRFPFRSIFIDADNETILEDIPAKRLGYICPRWGRVSGSQYGYSLAATAAMGNARTLQRLSLTMLEAAERAVDPAYIAVGEAIQNGVQNFPSGITYVSADYDERTGEALRTIPVDKGGLNWGLDREKMIREEIKEAFFINQLQMPDTKTDETAYETQQRLEENMRRALPLFEPMESGWSAKICETAFAMAMDLVAFRDLASSMPPALANQPVRFAFESPLQAARTRAQTQAFMQASNILQIAAQLDPHIGADYDIRQATRDAVAGTQAPAEWTLPINQANALRKALADQQQSQVTQALQDKGIQQAATAADAAQKAGGGIKALSEGYAGLPPEYQKLAGQALGLPAPNQQPGVQ